MRRYWPTTLRLQTGMARVWRCRFLQKRSAILLRKEVEQGHGTMIGWFKL